MKNSLLHARDIRALADELGIRPTKTLGQNFVIDAGTVEKILRHANVQADDHVVEVGPGLGSLTLGLLQQVAKVTAVEIDPVLAAQLPHTVAARSEHADKLTVINQDALTLTELEQAPTALVANLPYNVSVPIVLHFLQTFPTLANTLVMVQLEVAERLAAAPGSRIYGVPSVKAAWYGSARKVATIGRNVFWPAPNVDSALVLITRGEPLETTASREEVWSVVDAAFAQRRKTLRAALATWAGSPAKAETYLVAAGIDPRTRGEQLTVADFARIAAARTEEGN